MDNYLRAINYCLMLFFFTIMIFFISSCLERENKKDKNAPTKNSIENKLIGKKQEVKDYSVLNDINTDTPFDTAIAYSKEVHCLIINNKNSYYKFVNEYRKFNNLVDLTVTGVNYINCRKLFNCLSEINSFERLEIDNLNYNCIITNNIYKLKNLRNLKIIINGRDNVIYLPDSIVFCSKLNWLEISNCAKLPTGIELLKNLEYIYLYHYFPCTFPKELTLMSNLKVISVGYKINSIPQEILKLKKLQKLYLIGNPIAKRELRYLIKYHKYNELNFIYKALPDCKLLIQPEAI